MSQEEICNILEAALLAAGRPLTLPELAQLFDEPQRPAPAILQAALAELQSQYESRALELKQTASGYRLQVRARYGSVIARLWPERPQRYSRALLETLALIAYRQPITRAEIEAVRGVTVNPNIIKTLLERQWVRVVGHRELPGRPELLGTTREFLDYFGLRTLGELPPLSELRSLEPLDPQELQPQLPVVDVGSEAPGPEGGAERAVAADAAEAEDPGDTTEAEDGGDAADGQAESTRGPSSALVAAPADPAM